MPAWFYLLCDVSKVLSLFVWNTQVSREAGAEFSACITWPQRRRPKEPVSCPLEKDSEAVAEKEKVEIPPF